ncbi:Antitoxin HigA [Aquisphaera giovannonii]|uniref:Antitoxin HigA n=1 Tax=Aquisphaera giovannonii TaxID=406548 RepID=A0A5B9W5N3_9BACT|nr:helix-turn-helix domain-containing protein [Aquisphaera giovannonii]QEH35627.1 Antitoxin HigA [Aquisphaera giovannonii]
MAVAHGGTSKPTRKQVTPKSRSETKPSPPADSASPRPVPRAPASYFSLVEEFRLERIRDDDHLARALAVVDRLMARDLDEGEQSYLDALVDLIEVYEEKAYPIPAASESEVLEELMGQRKLTETALAEQTGIAQSTISDVLRGERELTKDHVVTLAKFFHVSPQVFLPGT